MNISIQERENSRALIAISLEEVDYAEKLTNELKRVAKTANVPGFRKGKVPTGMIKKMMGEAVRKEVVSEMVFDELEKFTKEQELRTLLYPVPLEQNTAEMEKVNPSLLFNLALIPTEEMNFDFSDITLDKYEAEISEEDINKVIENMQNDASDLVEVDTVAENALLNGTIAELEGDISKENGIVVDSALLFPDIMKDEAEKAKFANATKNSMVTFEPYKAFNGEAGELTSLLGIDREGVDDLKGKEFSYQIERIRVRKPAELNQEFFNKMFGEGEVDSIEVAREKVKEILTKNAEGNANFIFAREFMNKLDEERAQKIDLADEVILESYKIAKRNDEETDREFDHEQAIKALKEELFIRELAKKHEIEVTHEEILSYVESTVRSQFAQFGWTNPDPEIVSKQALNMLKENGNYAYNAEMNILRQRIADKIQEEVHLNIEKVSLDKLNNLLTSSSEKEKVLTEEAENKDSSVNE